jgi:hypothetical protein
LASRCWRRAASSISSAVMSTAGQARRLAAELWLG